MRVFIDARDLINIFNHSRPVSASELWVLFTKKGHELILPFSLISELVPADNNDIVTARRFSAIEALPHVFFQQQALARQEIAQAAEDVANGRVPRPLRPFVVKFQDLWADGSDPLFHVDLNRTIVMGGLAFQVCLVARQAPHVFHWSRGEAADVVQTFHRARANRQPLNTKNGFQAAVVRWLRDAGLEAADENSLHAFTTMLRENPRLAPGWRLYVEVFDQLTSDRTYKPTVNDLWDLANVTMLPYVDAITLDKNQIDLIRRANSRLAKYDETIRYAERAFASIESLLRHIC